MKLNFSSLFSLYEIGAQVTATGPEPDPPVWKIYDAIDRQNGKVSEMCVSVYHTERMRDVDFQLFLLQTV